MPALDIDNAISSIAQFATIDEFNYHLETYLKFRDVDDRKAARSLLGLRRACSANMLLAMFTNGSHSRVKYWGYCAAKSNILYVHHAGFYPECANPVNSIFPLLSENSQIIHWYSQFWGPIINKTYKGVYCCEIPGRTEHFTLQFCRVLSGELEKLEVECANAVTAEVSVNNSHKPDYEFLLAICSGDPVEVQRAFNSFFSANRIRIQSGFGFPAKFMSCWAIIYAKIANLYGVDVDSTSEWYPSEFMTTKSSGPDSYLTGREEFDDIDIFFPFKDGLNHSWTNKTSLLTPKPPREILSISAVRDSLV